MKINLREVLNLGNPPKQFRSYTMADKTNEKKKSKPKKKRLSKGMRKHIRLKKSEARKLDMGQNQPPHRDKTSNKDSI
jgi:hypothetical protein